MKSKACSPEDPSSCIAALWAAADKKFKAGRGVALSTYTLRVELLPRQTVQKQLPALIDLKKKWALKNRNFSRTLSSE